MSWLSGATGKESGKTDRGELEELRNQAAAFSRSQAMIEFMPDGRIVTANQNFLATLGYSLEEIKGQHHSMFVDPAYRASPEYRAFWDKLGRGEFDAGQYKRFGKGGREIWIQASYNPVLDANGKPCKVVKLATDITAAKLAEIAVELEWRGQIEALSRSQAMIEFTIDGRIVNANRNFLATLGYSLDEIKGQHHSMFADPAYRTSAEYRAFWDKLGRGEFDAGQYQRFGKGGKEIWIQASYNPVLDTNGKPCKVVKIATDITAAKKAEQAAEAAEKTIEREINEVITAAVAGDFSQRLKLDGKSGFMLNLATAMNGLSENISKALQDLVKMLGALSNGDLSQRITAHYEGAFATLKNDANGAAERINGTIDDLVQMLGALAEGDLTPRITADYQGNFGPLKDDTNKMAERISTTISEIKSAAREVTNASAEIATSTTDLSQRTEEQAASLEETSASMEQISATVKKNAENAQQANQSANSTREVADRGGQVVAKAVDAMAKIEESSRKISDIIGVIDEIARQTNLLALNAAVEAARAGEAGRGFAVVASEVRSLAQRSSQAAKDIKDLITNSNHQVKDGVDLVNRAGTALGEIVESIKKVAEIVSDIAHASSEQATGLEQVNKALAQMDEVTQQNSALVEENAATAKTLEQQAKSMDERVSFFQVDEAAPPARASRPAAAPIALQPRAPAPVKRPVSAPLKRAGMNGGGPVGRMQSALAVAVKDQDWKEF